MLSIIYTFVVKENKEEEFIKYWSELTNLIYKHAGSLGSRLHQETKSKYMAYALWPDEKTFDDARENLPEKAIKVGEQMRSRCASINIVFKANLVKDLIQKEPY